MPVDKLRAFLDEHHVKYVTIRHSRAFTAQEVADSAHIPGKEVAKTVIVRMDGRLAMVVLPAPEMISLDGLRAATGASTVELASEKEFSSLFPNCEVGAMPPFGNLWNMDVYCARSLSEDRTIAFSAGNHHEVIQLPFETYRQLVEPVIVRISRRR